MITSSAELSVRSWWHHLLLLTPPTGAVVIGAGCGEGRWINRLIQDAVANVLLVEADEGRFERLRQGNYREDWRLRAALVAEEATDVAFFEATVGMESGLLDPECLHSFWPNIKARRVAKISAVTLASLQEATGGAYPNWLVVDCLPALQIIRGAAKCLKDYEVIVARVVLEKSGASIRDAGRTAVEAYLHAQGFRLLAIDAERHPEIGHALFLRDSGAAVQLLRQQTHEMNMAFEARMRDVEQRSIQFKQVIAELRAVCEEKAMTAAEAQAHAAQLAQTIAAADRLAVERRLEVENLMERGDNLERACEEAFKAVTDARVRIEALEQQLEETKAASANATARESHLHSELLKAEAQIDLIRELTLERAGAR